MLKCGLAHLNAYARDVSNAIENPKNTASESNENVNANAQQLSQMQMHLDQMQMLFYNYVFLR